jgi:DNA polymerase III alpha subunit
MTPVFKSTFSIGKSILKLEEIIASCKQHDINPLVLVEDSMTGFVKSHTVCKEEGIHLIFGLRITCCNDVKEEGDLSDHKIIIFAKDDEGCKLLNKIYSFSQMLGDGKVDCEYLNSVWSETSLGLVIPFYDSFIHNNQLYLKNCIPDFKNILPTFLLERNNLPFDHLLAEKVIKFAASTTRPVERVKTILYNKKADVEALQTYKILCNRNFGRAATLSSPNLNHFGSNEFCLESYLQYA